MNISRLSFDDMPPLAIPLRFHLTAPVFGLAAAALLLVEGPSAWLSRWTAGSLGATHLLTLGFMSMVMIGSLFQVIPVITGRSIPGTRQIAPVVHVALCAGVVALTWALIRPDAALFKAAIALLALAFVPFITALSWRVMSIRRGGVSVFTIRLAALALLGTVGLGVFLAVGRTWPEFELPFRSWTDIHVVWGLFGWMPLLVMGVSYQVIPMFHVAPEFDSRLARGVPLVVFLSLVALSHSRSAYLVVPIVTCLAIALITYAVMTLRILARRKRKRPDATVSFWRLSLGALVVGTLLLWSSMSTPLRAPILEQSQVPILLGVIMVFGVACSVIIGMLQKIVPFLVFLHLQRMTLSNLPAMRLVPKMNDVISDRDARWQFRLHATACVAVLLALIWPTLGRVAALALALDFGWLLRDLVAAAARYRRIRQAIEAVAS
ncbi:MAG: hypothetical protein QF570_17515 [Myxococcota bacterium]|nr:hypothetical protein [Myxococcota bacterium]